MGLHWYEIGIFATWFVGVIIWQFVAVQFCWMHGVGFVLDQEVKATKVFEAIANHMDMDNDVGCFALFSLIAVTILLFAGLVWIVFVPGCIIFLFLYIARSIIRSKRTLSKLSKEK